MALLTAHGVPMILMGDECGASKGGNNNTYCHDSPLNWLDWRAATSPDNAFARFFRHLVNFRCRPAAWLSVDAHMGGWSVMQGHLQVMTASQRLP